MPENRKIVKVFLASPGDLKEERTIAKNVADEINDLWSDLWGYQIELVGWEDTVSRFGRPQDLINQDLVKCEYFIGLMWKRWGSPPDNEGLHSSGFSEEFETSLKKMEEVGRPKISLFFKSIEIGALADPGEQLSKVIAFKKRIVEEKKILYEEFAGHTDFRSKIVRCLTRLIQDLEKVENKEDEDDSQVKASGASPKTLGQELGQQAQSIFSAEGVTFLRSLIERPNADSVERLDKFEAARLRLISTFCRRPGNDENVLGVHDANLLYEARNNNTFGQVEIFSLIEAGLEHYGSETVPVWYWFAQIKRSDASILTIQASLGATTNIKVGALRLMRIMKRPIIPFGNDRTRTDIIRDWLKPETPTPVQTAVLAYLSDCGVNDDLEIISAAQKANGNANDVSASQALINIAAKTSKEAAFDMILLLQPSIIDKPTIDAVLGNIECILTATIRKGLASRCERLREALLLELVKREALKEQDTDDMLKDASPYVRFEAVRQLRINNNSISFDDAEKIIKPPKNQSLGLLAGRTGVIEDLLWRRYKEEFYELKPTVDLEESLASSSIFDQTGRMVLYKREFEKHGDTLRFMIRDRFQSYFDGEVKRWTLRFGDDRHVEKMQPLSGYIRQGLVRDGLNVIESKGGLGDVNLVREVLQSNFVEMSGDDLRYLYNFGDWNDINLILDYVNEKPHRLSAVYGLDVSLLTDVVRTIFRLGKHRIAELIIARMPAALMSALLEYLPIALISKFDDAQLIELLSREEDVVRRSAVLKIGIALSKSRTEAIYDLYLDKEWRYYNIVYWLDLILSMPRAMSRIALRRAFELKPDFT